MTWTVVVPVKPPALAKSRLRVDGVDRSALARAIALDTIEAAAAAARVIVVSADTTLRLAGCELVRETATGGLAAAIELGLAAAPRERRAVLLGDLPGLRPEDLALALELAGRVRLGAVPDAERLGTTLLTSREGDLPAAFGDGSWRRHLAAGFTELPLAPDSTLHRDVDLAEHLHAPLGPRTRALLSARSAESGAG